MRKLKGFKDIKNKKWVLICDIKRGKRWIVNRKNKEILWWYIKNFFKSIEKNTLKEYELGTQGISMFEIYLNQYEIYLLNKTEIEQIKIKLIERQI